MATNPIKTAARTHAKEQLGPEQFKSNKNAARAIAEDFEAGYVAGAASRQVDFDMLVADYEEWGNDVKALARELDVALHGPEGAAPQAALCDLIGPVKELVARMQPACQCRVAMIMRGADDKPYCAQCRLLIREAL